MAGFDRSRSKDLREIDLHVRRHFEEVFLAIGLDVFLGVDWQLLVGVDGYQDLPDVGLQVVSGRLILVAAQLAITKFKENSLMTSLCQLAYVNYIFTEALIQVLNKDVLVRVVFEEHGVRHAGFLTPVQVPLHSALKTSFTRHSKLTTEMKRTSNLSSCWSATVCLCFFVHFSLSLPSSLK